MRGRNLPCPSTNMKSIARRIANLEMTLSPQPETEHRRGRGWRSRAPSHVPIYLRFGNLCRLPADYQGERHTVMTTCLPDRDGQKWAEFTEVPGPAPSQPPQDPRLPRWINVVFVSAYPPPS